MKVLKQEELKELVSYAKDRLDGEEILNRKSIVINQIDNVFSHLTNNDIVITRVEKNPKEIIVINNISIYVDYVNNTGISVHIIKIPGIDKVIVANNIKDLIKEIIDIVI